MSLLLLQRKLRGDAAKWRTLGRFPPADLDSILKASDHLARMLEMSIMRIVEDRPGASTLARWDDGMGWALKEAPPG